MMSLASSSLMCSWLAAACAASIATLDIYEKEGLFERAQDEVAFERADGGLEQAVAGVGRRHVDLVGQVVFQRDGHAQAGEGVAKEAFAGEESVGPGGEDFVGDGLFTAYTDEPNWAKAHRILVPAFGPIAIRGMFDRMLDIADQLVAKWERLNADEEIDVVRDMTALTLDTIGLCGFNYRFNSFYRSDNHPYVESLVRAQFDLRPYCIVKMLDLVHPMYRATAAYGHFGREPVHMTYKWKEFIAGKKVDKSEAFTAFTWEKTDKAEALRKAAGLKK